MTSPSFKEENVPFKTIFYEQSNADIMNPRFQILYDYWQSIPTIKEIPSKNDELLSHPIRQAILSIMRIGIIEHDPRNTIKKFRHVFTPRELTKFIPYLTSTPIKITNTYYHIQVLKENDFIQPIASIKKGKNKFTYYGRTGKIFLYTKEVPFLPNNPLRKKSFLALLKSINPQLDETELENLLNRQNTLTKQNYEKIKQWIYDHAQAISDSHIDIRFLFGYFEYLFTINPKIQELNKQILDLLDYKMPL